MHDERGLAHRRLLIVSGNEDWAKMTVDTLLSRQSEDNILRYAARDGRHKVGDITRILGKEYHCVVFDMFAGFDPDALAACTGTLVAGGCLLLVTPDFERWKGYADPYSTRYLNWPYQVEDIQQRFLQRFIHIVENSDYPEVFTEQSFDILPIKPFHAPLLQATRDQERVIHALLHHYQSQVGWPVVLQADRGRGKSSALALFVNQVIKNRSIKIGVYAPSKLSLHSFYQQGNALEEHIVFKTVEALMQHAEDIDLLLIDEAATVSMHTLKQVLQHHSNVVLSTTLQGYEGSGHGFSIRLRQHLNEVYPGWTELSMQKPIRYAEDDPLERFIHTSLLLDVPLPDLAGTKNINPENCEFMQVSRTQLMRDEPLLQEIVSLLVIAHYQTRPSDLRYLLDGIKVTIYLAKQHGTLIAAALTVQEGGFDSELAQQIHYGNRRPRGSLVPQSLIHHLGMPEIAPFTTERVMRIVVHPMRQNQGVGSALLKYMMRAGSTCHYWSTSFALTGLRIARFWRKAGFQLVRIGMRRDKSSGHRSVMMVSASWPQVTEILIPCYMRFYKQYSVLRKSEYADISKDIVDALGVGLAPTKAEFDGYDQRDLDAYCDGNRPLESCLYAIKKWLDKLINQRGNLERLLDEQDSALVQAKIIEHQPWRDVCSTLKYHGKQQAKERLRQVIHDLRKCQQTEL